MRSRFENGFRFCAGSHFSCPDIGSGAGLFFLTGQGLTALVRAMKLINRFLTAGLILAAAAAGQVQAQDPELSPEDQELMKRVSVAYGTRLARDLREDGIYLDMEIFAEAFLAISKGDDPRIDEEGIVQAFEELRAYMERNYREKQAEFLAENGKNEGVTTTASGLQWEVLTAAEGPKPNATDTVTVHYVGTLIDGTQFDSSVDRGQPASFQLDAVIEGWTEGVALMPKGSKYRFVIPAEIGYGERGSPSGEIPPGATLVFEVELLKINGQ